LDIVEIQDNKDDINLLMTKTASRVQSDPSAAQPPTLLHPELPEMDQMIQPVPVQEVEPKVGQPANS
jgi:hypothetical protein